LFTTSLRGRAAPRCRDERVTPHPLAELRGRTLEQGQTSPRPEWMSAVIMGGQHCGATIRRQEPTDVVTERRRQSGDDDRQDQQRADKCAGGCRGVPNDRRQSECEQPMIKKVEATAQHRSQNARIGQRGCRVSYRKADRDSKGWMTIRLSDHGPTSTR
jgi:hypothetical protein